MLVTLSVITLAELPGQPPVLRRAHTLTTVARTFPTAEDAVGALTQLLALPVAHGAGPRELAQLPEPATLADAPSAGAEAVTSTDLPIDVLTLPVVTLAVLPVDAAVSRRVTGTLSTLTQASSEAGQLGRPPTPLQAALQGQRAGQGVLALVAVPALLAVAPPTVTLAVTRAEVVGVSVVGGMAAPLVTLAGVPVDVSPVSRRVHVVARALPAHAVPSVAADFAIWRRAFPLALPRADVTLEFTFVSMPTGGAVTVSTVTLAVASTHLSRVLVQTLAVVTLTEAARHQSLAVGVVAHAAAAVAGACVGADHSLRVPAELLALLVGEITHLLVLAGLSGPVLVALTLPTVTVAAVPTGFAIVCRTGPVVTFTTRPVELL